MGRLRAETLFFRRSKIFFLGPLSLDCEAGEILALVGPNGGGKSTLLSLLAGVLKPQEGEVLLNGERLGNKSAREIARTIGYLPQKIAPFYSFPAAEVVAMGRFSLDGGNLDNPAVSDAVRRAMEKTGTTALYHRPFQELSGGEQQGVLLASLLVRNPEILLLDEPTSGLDPHHGVAFFKLLLSESRASGLSAMVACHDLNLASAFADRVVLMNRGQNFSLGTPEEVFQGKFFQESFGGGLKVWPHPDGRGGLILLPESEEDR